MRVPETPRTTDRTSVTTPRRAVAALALATVLVASAAANACQDGTSSPPPTSQCSDFGCER